MEYQKIGRTYVSEARYGNAMLFHVSSLQKVREILDRMETGKTHFHTALTKKLSADLEKVGISANEIRKDLDAVFERAESIENGAAVRCRRGLATLSGHRISEKGHFYVGATKEGRASEISITPFVTKTEGARFAKELSKIATKYGLRLVDWTKPQEVDLSEESETAAYFEDIADEDPVPEEPAPKAKKGFGHYVTIAIMVAFISSLAHGVMTLPKTGVAPGWEVMAFWIGISVVIFGGIKMSIQKVSEEGLKMSNVRPSSVLTFAEIRFLTSRYDNRYSIYRNVKGEMKEKRMDRTMLTGGWDSFWKILYGMRKARIERQKGATPDVAKPSEKEFLDAFRSTCLKDDRILFRDFVLKLLKKLPARKRFLKKYYEAQGFFFDGATFSGWDFTETERKERSDLPDYSPLAKEKLSHLGSARGSAYDVLIGDSGKLYASRGTRLYLFGENSDEGLYRFLTDGDPIACSDFLEGKPDPLEICSLRWHECDVNEVLVTLKKRVPDFEKTFTKGSVVPVLERGHAEEFLIYDTSSQKFFGICGEDDEHLMKAELLEDEKSLMAYLSNRHMRSKILCPEPLRDQYLREMGEASGAAMTEKDWESLRIAEREGKTFETAETEAGCMLASLESNPDWKPVWSVFTEDRYARVYECVGKWKLKIDTEFRISAENYWTYMDQYGGSFGKPKAMVSPIFKWLKKPETEPTGEYCQYSIIIRNSMAHEAVFDLCSIMGIAVNPNYLAKALENDGLPGIHSMAIFPNRETGEFVVLDCQNVGDNFCLTARVDEFQADNVRARMTEWENHLRSERGHRVECESVKNEIDDPESPLYVKMNDYGITENDFMNNDPDEQFAYRGSLKHKIDRLRWKWRI